MLAMPVIRRGATPLAHRGAISTKRRDLLIGLGALLVSALFLFFDARPMPILLWDESRNIVNALEMDRSGFSLGTTYDGAPDLWNTKPPLMIWLMVASVRLFGSSEWALRLPGMLASLGTLTIVMVFMRRVTGSIWTGVLAAFLLVISPALLGEHGARTADYDSLLTFFVTSYLLLLFGAIHHTRPTPRRLALIALCVTGAVMTKSIAGLVPGLGVAAYLLFVGRVPRLWRGWGYIGAGVATVAAIGLFLLIREVQTPGYLAASWYNDGGGRFAEALETARKPATFYLADLLAGYFAAPLLLLLSLIAMRWMSARARLVTVYGLAVVVTFLAVISIVATKLHHYILPVLPLMAIVAALTFRAIIRRLAETFHGERRLDRLVATAFTVLAVFPLLGATEGAMARRYLVKTSYAEGAPSRLYGPLFERLTRQTSPITVVDPGFVRDEDKHYVAVLRAYRLMWLRRGVSIGWVTDMTGVAPGIVASCKPEIVPALLAQGSDIGGIAGCAAILRR